MNITQFYSYRPTRMYGGARHTDEIDKRLPSEINRVYIKDASSGGEFKYFLKVSAKYFCNQGDINHFTDPKMAFASRYNPSNSIITIHDCIGTNYYEYKGFNTVMGNSFNGFDAVVTVSEFSRRDISETYDIDINKIHIVHNGVDHHAFYPTPGMKLDDTLRLLYVGNTLPHKNIGYMFDVMKQLKKSVDVPVEMVRVGYTDTGDEQQVRESLRLKKKSEYYGVKFRDVGFIASSLIYNTASVYVAPSFYEGFNIPIIESMACNVPVVASNRTSHPEVVGDAGKLVEYDVDAWVDAILNVTIDKDKYYMSRMFNNVMKFDWEHSARQLAQVYVGFDV